MAFRFGGMIVAALVAGLALTGCKGPSVAGTWDGKMMGNEATYRFEPGGVLTVTMGKSTTFTGRWSQEKERLNITLTSMSAGGKTIDLKAAPGKGSGLPYTLEGDTLTIKGGDADPKSGQPRDVVLTRVKEN